MHVRAFVFLKNFPGVIPPDPRWGREGMNWEKGEGGKGGDGKKRGGEG
jgi:hypothetical protein